jgi:hypothetical protein
MMLLVMLVMRHRLLEERHKERKIQTFKQKVAIKKRQEVKKQNKI